MLKGFLGVHSPVVNLAIAPTRHNDGVVERNQATRALISLAECRLIGLPNSGKYLIEDMTRY